MVAQSTNMPWFQGMNYGAGVNLLNGNIAGRAVDAGPVTEPTGADGQIVTYNLQKVSSFADLYEAIGISVAVSGQYGLFSADGKFKYAKESNFNSQATFLVAHCVVQNAFAQVESPRLVADAIDLVKRGKTDVFQGRYGDGYVRGMQSGGEFACIISVTCSTKEMQESIAADLQAKYGGLFASAQVDVSLDTSSKSKIGKSELSISSLQRGGSGDEQSITSDVEAVMARLVAFPAQVARHPVPYGVQVASYATLALPDGPNLIDIRAQNDALAAYARLQLKLLALANDVEFLQLHPEFFVDPPAAATVSQWQQFFTDELNRLTHQASACTDDAKSCDLFALQMPDGFAMPQRKPDQCPAIGGIWRRSDGGRTIQFLQDGFAISCVDNDPSYEHHGTGQWNGTAFDYAVTRKNIVTGCVTQMFGQVAVPAPGQLTLNITASDGLCDLPRTFAEASQWQKA